MAEPGRRVEHEAGAAARDFLGAGVRIERSPYILIQAFQITDRGSRRRGDGEQPALPVKSFCPKSHGVAQKLGLARIFDFAQNPAIYPKIEKLARNFTEMTESTRMARSTSCAVAKGRPGVKASPRLFRAPS